MTWSAASYDEDLALWRRLADAQPGAVLDVGAGTGRTTLALARAGHAVIALDLDAELLAVLRERAGRACRCGRSSPTRARSGSARSSGSASCRCRRSSCSAARAAAHRSCDARARTCEPGGLLAVAIAEELECFEVVPGGPGPLPDVAEIDGVVYSSRPTAVRRDGDGFELERRRETVDPRRTADSERNLIRLDALDADTLEREARRGRLHARRPAPRSAPPRTTSARRW